MYSTAKKISLFTAILGTVNIVGVILFLLASAELRMNFALSFSIFIIFGSSAAVNLLTTVALRSICQDLEYEYENTTSKLNKMDKKVTDLASRI